MVDMADFADPVKARQGLVLDQDKLRPFLDKSNACFRDLLEKEDMGNALEKMAGICFSLFSGFAVKFPTACEIKGKGCSFCCGQPVAASFAEGWAIAQALSLLPGDRRADSLARLEIMADHPSEGYLCPFLHEDGGCRIYQVRPLSCRAYISLSREDCEKEVISGFIIPFQVILIRVLYTSVKETIARRMLGKEVKGEFILAHLVRHIFERHVVFSESPEEIIKNGVPEPGEAKTVQSG